MRFILDIVVAVAFGLTAIFLYQNYWDDVTSSIFNSGPFYTLYVGSNAIDVTVADEYNERVLGLGGIEELRDSEGKLFIFDTDEKHGIWMKDMRIPIDIIWINKNLEVVHTTENVTPDTYPEIFYPSSDVRFAVEVNAHFVSSFKVKVGDKLILPPVIIPVDIKRDLQQ